MLMGCSLCFFHARAAHILAVTSHFSWTAYALETSVSMTDSTGMTVNIWLILYICISQITPYLYLWYYITMQYEWRCVYWLSLKSYVKKQTNKKKNA